jgi:hypothetical protein
MSEPEVPPEKDAEKLAAKPDDAPGWADVAAIGIGCLVVVIFFAAIILVGIMRADE